MDAIEPISMCYCGQKLLASYLDESHETVQIMAGDMKQIKPKQRRLIGK